MLYFLWIIQEVDEEKEHLPATNIDDVTITFDDHEVDKPANEAPFDHPLSTTSPLQKENNSKKNLVSGNTTSAGNLSTAVSKSGSVDTATNTAHETGQNNGRVEGRDPQKEDLDSHFQNMFLERMANNTRPANKPTRSGGSFRQQSQQKFYPPPMMDKTKNGLNNNNNTATEVPPPSTSTPAVVGRGNSFRDGQLRRFVAPPNSPVVGADDDDKERCCVIL